MKKNLLTITKRICFVLILCVQLSAIAQNLVPNSSFEILTDCPSASGQITNASGWYSPTDISADLYSTCSPNPNHDVPTNIAGTQMPATDSTYVGFFAYRPNDKRSYAATSLSQALTPGKSYCVSFKVSLADLAYVAVQDIGIYFSTDPVSIVNGGLNLGFTPQVVNTNGPIDDKSNWTTISGTFTADDAYQWITIGNFLNNASTTTSSLPGAAGPLFNRSYYYLEDVSVEELPDFGISVSPFNSTVVCENDAYTLHVTGGTGYSWVDAADPFNVLSTLDSLVVDSASATTTYIVTIDNGACSRVETFVIDVLPVPQADFSVSATCTGYATQFLDSSTDVFGSAAYTWNFGDGNTATTGGGTSHIYAAAGSYAVVLTVSNGACESSHTIEIQVTDCDPCVEASNLAYNPSGEAFIQCPTALSQAPVSDGYFSPTAGTPDYFNACSTGDSDVPDNAFGTQIPAAGNAYFGIYAYAPFNYREYLGGILAQPLSPDSVYCVSFDVSLADLSGRAIENLGIYFSDSPLSIPTQNPLPFVPQISNVGNGVVSNSSGWTTITGTFSPTTAVQWFAIGNFNDNAGTTNVSIPGADDNFKDVGYYFIDNVSVVKMPRLSLPNDTLQVCINEPVNLAVSDVYCNYLWYDANDLSTSFSETNSAQIISATPGLFAYVVQAAFGQCHLTDTVYVAVNDLPQANFEVLPNCAGNATIFTNTTQNAVATTTYYWDFESDGNNDLTTIGLGNVGHTYTTPDTVYQAQLIAETLSGCTDTVQIPIVITGACDPCVQQNIIANSDFAAGVCPTDLGQLSNAALWTAINGSPDLFAACGNAQNGIPDNAYGQQAAYNGNYYAGFTAYNHGSPTTPQEFIAQQLLTPLEEGVTYCFKMQVSLAENSDYAIDELGFLATQGAYDPTQPLPQNPQVFNPVNVIQFDTLGWREISGSFTADANYDHITIGNFNWYNPNVLLVGTPGSGVAYYYLDGVAISPLTASVSEDTTICAGQPTLLTATTSTCSYYWTALNNPSVILSDSLTLLVSPSVTTDYVFYGSNGNCDITDTVRVNVNPLPVVSISNNTAVCMGGSVTLSASGGDTYLWSSGNNTPSFEAVISSDSTFCVTVTNALGCSANACVTVTANLPPVADAGEDTYVCLGDSVRLSASGGDTYLWAAANGLALTTIADPFVSPSSTTTYYVTVSNSATGCSAIDSVTVLVPVSMSVADTTFLTTCAGQAVQLINPQVPNNATTYTWSPATGLNDPNVFWPQATITNAQTYTVTFTDAYSCAHTAAVHVDIVPVPDAGEDALICPGGSVMLSASGGGISYSWSPATGLDDPSLQTPTASPNDTTTYTVTVVYPNSVGTCTQTDEVTVFVAPQGFADINILTDNLLYDSENNAIVCSGQTIDLQAFGGDTFVWDSNPTISTTNNDSVSVTPATTTTYYVNVTNSITGCPVRDSITIVVKPDSTPVVDDSLIDSYYCATFATPLSVCVPFVYDGCRALSLSVSGGSGSASVLGGSPELCFTYQPTPSAGIDTLQVLICAQGTALCDTAQYIVVNNTCDTNPPTWGLTAASDTTYQNVPATLNLHSYSDSDAGDNLSLSVGTVLNGTVTLNGNLLTYTPNTDYVGTETFEVYVCDSYYPVQCDTLPVTITVLPLPNCDNTPVEVCARSGVSVPVCVSFCALENPQIQIAASSCNNCTQLLSLGDTCVLYVPPIGVQTIDTLTLVAFDANMGIHDTAVAYINIGCNQPVANNDEAFTVSCAATTFNVLANDADACGDLLYTQLAAQPAHGTATLNLNKTLTYVSNSGFVGVDTVRYWACNQCDLGPVCTEALWIVNVAENIAPTTFDITLYSSGFTPVNVCLPYQDPENSPVTSSIVVPPAIGGNFTNFTSNCFTYTPTILFGTVTDTVTFTAQICDNCGNCSSALVTIVRQLNNPPIAQDTTVTTTQNVPILICPTVDEPDGDAYSLDIISTTTNGTIELVNDTCILYTPAPGFVGTTTVDVLICDDLGSCTDIITITINVEAGGNTNPPIVPPITTTTPFNTPAFICETSATDPDGDALTLTQIVSVSSGTVVNFNPNTMCLTYDPADGFVGDAVIVVQICDVFNNCTNGTITVTVSPPVNNPPTVLAETYTTPVNTPIQVCVTASDPDGDPITLTSANANPNGSISDFNTTPFCFTFTPNSNFEGQAPISVTVCDDQGACTTQTIIVQVVGGANLPPAVNDTIAATAFNNPLVFCYNAGSATDPDGDPITITQISGVDNGVVDNGNLTDLCFTYTPNTGWVGNDTITATVCDNAGNCTTGQIIIIVLSGNNLPPVIVTQGPIQIVPDATLTNCIDVSDNTGNVVSVTVNTALTTPPGATINIIPTTGCASGYQISYTPPPGYHGSVHVFLDACDDFNPAACTTGEAFGIVVDGFPAVNDITLNVPQNANSTACVTILDEPSNTHSTVILDGPENGSAAVTTTGCIEYTPTGGFIGMDSILVQICDNYNQCDTAYIYLNVEDQFVANDDAITAEDGVSVTGNWRNNDLNGTLADTVYIQTPPSNGTVVINENGTYTYTPAIGFVGTDSFTYTICDNSAATNYGCDTATVFITVNNALQANNDNGTTPENTSITINVLGNDITPAAVTPVIILQPANGVLSNVGSGSYIYLPDPGFAGLDSFIYVISLPGYGTDTAVVYITVLDSGQNPLANNDSDTTDANQSVTIDVLNNDSNPNGNGLEVTEIVTAPAHGTVTINADGTLTYAPALDYSGTDSFVYQVCDDVLGNLCATATVTIVVNEVVEPNCTIVVHGAISPNGDNKNDALVIDGLDCAENQPNELYIYNRWGSVVFEAQNYGTGDLWDGTWQKNGELLPDGTYFYILKIPGQNIEKQGYIEVNK